MRVARLARAFLDMTKPNRPACDTNFDAGSRNYPGAMRILGFHVTLSWLAGPAPHIESVGGEQDFLGGNHARVYGD